MSLDRLPEELLILIFRQLDLHAIRNVYDTGNHRLRDIIRSQSTVKKARLSLSSLATAHTLKMDFFRAISMNLQELDLSAVHDLTKSELLPAVRKMTNLVTLNVAYTNLTILDLIKIYEVCSTIKNITVNFQFHKPYSELNLPDLKKCQDLFSNFENVHFVGSVENLFYSCLPLHILQKAKLNTVTYTIALIDKMFTVYKYVETKAFNCNKFTLKMHYEESHFTSLARMEGNFPNPIKNAPFEYEYVHFFDGAFFISPAFYKHFKENYKNRSIYMEPLQHLQPFKTISENSNPNNCLIIWNKETTNFNEIFFHELDYELKKLDACLINYDVEMQPVVISHDWVHVVHPSYVAERKKDENLVKFKRKRVASPNITLDYDKILKDKRYVELTICFEYHFYCAVTLSSTSNFLKKLTFLQLRGVVHYSREFFNILFRCCENLITLDVEGNYTISAPPISRSIPLSQSIKNLRIVDKTIDLHTLFSSLSQSVRLENIQIVNASNVPSDIPSCDTLFKQCDNLYYLSICGPMSDAARTKSLTMLNKAKLKYNRRHLFIEVGFNKLDSQFIYEPFLNVFKLKRKTVCSGL